MTAQPRTTQRRRGGIISVLSIQFLAIFAALGVAMAGMANLEVQKADRLRAAAEARLAAESGLAIVLATLRDADLPASVDASSLVAAVGATLSTRPVFAGAAATVDATTHQTVLTLGEVQLATGRFTSQIAAVMVGTDPGCRVTVTGRSGAAVRSVAIDLVLRDKRSSAFDYGVISRGTVVLSGSARIVGRTDAGAATILSTRHTSPAISLGAGTEVTGELYATGPTEDYVELLGGGATVAGCGNEDRIMSHHVHLGVLEPEFPPLDAEPIKALAVNEFAATGTETGKDVVLTNVRIPAATNPRFAGKVVINGVLYIQSPNEVHFNGGVTVNGIIVTDDDPEQRLRTCQIVFRGNASAPGVDALPDTPEFERVRQYRGTVILAPGFGLDFNGSVGAANGVIAADQMAFSGSTMVSGDLGTAIVGLKDLEMAFGGSAQANINRMPSDLMPAGFRSVKGLSVVPGTYRELAGTGVSASPAQPS